VSREDNHWPSWRYGPDGQAAIFQEGDEIPEGWVDSPGKAREKEWGAEGPTPSVDGEQGLGEGDSQEEWPLKTDPEKYLKMTPDGPKADLARKILGLDAEE